MEIESERQVRDFSETFTCNYCGRVIRVNLSDMYWISDGEDPDTGATHHEIVFKCVCGRRNWVSLNNKIPEWVKQEVFRKRKGEKMALEYEVGFSEDALHLIELMALKHHTTQKRVIEAALSVLKIVDEHTDHDGMFHLVNRLYGKEIAVNPWLSS